jgi:hypothetical protein
MASNLTTQVRGFAQISAAAMDGDFTRFITIEASGQLPFHFFFSYLVGLLLWACELTLSPLPM